jgi:hypothetical protein
METFPDPKPGRLVLLEAPRSVLRPALADWTARQAAGGTVRILDCGNSFYAYGVARALRCRTAQLQAALERILLARAFTCYQVVALLEQTPPGSAPTLALDLADTFQDDSVGLGERRRLFWGCMQRLRVLKRSTALLVSLAPHGVLDEKMVEQLELVADEIWQVHPPLPAPVLQPALW